MMNNNQNDEQQKHIWMISVDEQLSTTSNNEQLNMMSNNKQLNLTSNNEQSNMMNIKTP
jgi:hypothetical protein